MTALASHCCFLLNCKTDKKATENKQKRTPIILLPRKDQLSFWVLRVSLGSQKSELVPLRNGSAEQRTHIEKGLVHRLHPHSAPGAPGSCSPGPLHHLFAFFFFGDFPRTKIQLSRSRIVSALPGITLDISLYQADWLLKQNNRNTTTKTCQPSPQPM